MDNNNKLVLWPFLQDNPSETTQVSQHQINQNTVTTFINSNLRVSYGSMSRPHILHLISHTIILPNHLVKFLRKPKF